MEWANGEDCFGHKWRRTHLARRSKVRGRHSQKLVSFIFHVKKSEKPIEKQKPRITPNSDEEKEHLTMTATPPRRGSLSPSAIIGSPMPEGLRLPDVIITRRTRTVSMSCRIEDEVREGTVKFFCRSRGHGFINDDEAAPNDLPIFMHVSDIEGEYIPRKNDRVRYRACPMPPRYDRAQAVHIEIINFTPEVHHKWSEKETPEELLEEKEMIQEEARINEMIVKHRKSSGSIHSMEGGTP